jgi:alpha-galactosidase
MVYPTSTMRSWVTDWEGKNTYPLDFRFKVAMTGTLGIGSNLFEYTEKELEKAKENVELYKKIRRVVQFGDYYLLNSVYEDNYQAIQYSLEDETVVFIFINPKAVSNFESYNIKLRNLEDNCKYKINETQETFSGKALMKSGLIVSPDIQIDAAIRKKDLFKAKIITIRKDAK